MLRKPSSWKHRSTFLPLQHAATLIFRWIRAKAIALLNRLKSAHPDPRSDTHLRTLQRRVQQWRGIMVKKLGYAAAVEPMAELPAMPELALAGVEPRC